jgi:hypothetical protein
MGIGDDLERERGDLNGWWEKENTEKNFCTANGYFIRVVCIGILVVCTDWCGKRCPILSEKKVWGESLFFLRRSYVYNIIN